MKKNLFTLLALCAFLVIPNIGKANTVTIPNDPLTTLKQTSYLPIALKAANDNYGGTFSVSQQLYFASELSEASSTTIEGITFYCYDAYSAESSDYVRRKLRVWMNNTSITAFPDYATDPTPNFQDPGTKVFSSKKGNTDNGVEVTDLAPYTITFDTPFEWDGTSNILVTVFDSTGVRASFTTRHDMIQTTGVPRFLHQRTLAEDYADAGWSLSNLTAAEAVLSSDRGYVNKITFTFAAASLPPATPSDLAASSVGVTTASLSWSAVDGATSYKLFYSADGTIYSELATPSTNSYEWTGLTSGNTYYVKVAATNAVGDSEFSEPISFTTLVPHIHDGISFEPWSNPSAMPTSSNYYLANDVALDPYDPTTITLTGNLNLCLNGNTANLYGTKIVVPDGKTLAIYDNVGEGKITGFVASEVGISEDLVTSLIVVKGGGTLVLKQGTIENTYVRDADGNSYAIYSNGTVRVSGDVLINSNDADIYLYSTNVITLDGAINNAERHTVYKAGGAITSGWSTHMSGEDPRDYFESANSARSVCLNENEASLRLLLNLSESSLNSSISTSYGQVADVNLTRSLSSSQYNTFCLPFALSAAQMEEAFGAGYDLEEFVSSSLDDDLLSLTFNKVTTGLVAGKPYLIQPAVDVVNPSFEGVTIGAVSPADQTSDTYISFHGTFAPTELEGGNKNLLFLGAGNELFYPSTTANIYGFRAYFEVKGAAQKNGIRARIVKKENTATGIESISGEGLPVTGKKILRNGQLFIIRDGKTYNAQGQLVK